VSSVQREAMTVSSPFHVHDQRNRVCARGRTGDCNSAVFHVVPPSVVTSTFAIVPRPDHAMPVI
jgi:hypothetical protein